MRRNFALFRRFRNGKSFSLETDMKAIMWKKRIVGLSMALLMMANYSTICGQELNADANDESTTIDALDAFEAFETAGETIDPQQEHDQFERAYEKLYKLHGKGIQYQQIVHDEPENRVTTTNAIMQHGSNDDNYSSLTTTTMPLYELQTIDTSMPENISSIYQAANESVSDAEQSNGSGSDSDTINKSTDIEFGAGETVGDHSKFGKNIQRIVPVIFVPSDPNNISQTDNDSIDYVNDDGSMHEENSSQPIILPYPIDTTISSSQPSAVNHLQTNGKAITVPELTVTTTTTTTPVGPSPNDANIVYVLAFSMKSL